MTKKPDSTKKIGSIPPFGLRLRPDLKAKIEAAAAENGRSLNAEITHRLEASFSAPPRPILNFEIPEERLRKVVDERINEILRVKLALPKDE